MGIASYMSNWSLAKAMCGSIHEFPTSQMGNCYDPYILTSLEEEVLSRNLTSLFTFLVLCVTRGE